MKTLACLMSRVHRVIRGCRERRVVLPSSILLLWHCGSNHHDAYVDQWSCRNSETFQTTPANTAPRVSKHNSPCEISKHSRSLSRSITTGAAMPPGIGQMCIICRNRHCSRSGRRRSAVLQLNNIIGFRIYSHKIEANSFWVASAAARLIAFLRHVVWAAPTPS